MGWRGCHFAYGRTQGAEIGGFAFFSSMRFLLCMHGPCEMRIWRKRSLWMTLEGFSGPFSYIKILWMDIKKGTWPKIVTWLVKRQLNGALEIASGAASLLFPTPSIKVSRTLNAVSQGREMKYFIFKWTVNILLLFFKNTKYQKYVYFLQTTLFVIINIYVATFFWRNFAFQMLFSQLWSKKVAAFHLRNIFIQPTSTAVVYFGNPIWSLQCALIHVKFLRRD